MRQGQAVEETTSTSDNARSHLQRFPKRPALTVNALLVLAIVAFSYLFTIGVAIACVYLPLKLLVFVNSQNQFVLQAVLLALGGVLVAGLLLWSIFPRRQHFREPGIALDLSLHPKLQDLIIEITCQLNERLPDSVYLTLSTNASVDEHGGWFGFGRKRVLSLGLPLLAALNVSEFRAVLAHECAHYYGGDTVFLPFERSARAAMSRVLTSLAADTDIAEALQRLHVIAALHWLVGLVMSLHWRGLGHLSGVISRAQEFRCDELACYLASPHAIQSALEKIERVIAVQDHFWGGDVLPLLQRGARPSISTSLAEFLANPHISAAADRALNRRRTEEKPAPESSHPPLSQRLERIRRFQGASTTPMPDKPALSLINEVDSQELALVNLFFVNEDEVNRPKRVDWESVPEEVYIPEWQSFTERHAVVLHGIEIADVPGILNQPDSLAKLIANRPGRLLTHEQRAETVREVIVAAALLQLLRAGWKCVIRPGSRRFVKGLEEMEPWVILRQRPVNEVLWLELCAKEGLLERALYSAPPRAFI